VVDAVGLRPSSNPIRVPRDEYGRSRFTAGVFALGYQQACSKVTAARRGCRCATYEVAGEAWTAVRHAGMSAFAKDALRAMSAVIDAPGWVD
jgi:hypothetical protein